MSIRLTHLISQLVKSTPNTAPRGSGSARPALDHQTVRRALDDPARLTPTGVLALQRSIGNRAVQRMLQGQQHAPAGRLRVGPVDDKHEAQAESVARRTTGSESGPRVSRQALPATVQPDGGPVDRHTEQAILRAQGRGQPLGGGVQRRMEGALGTDLSNVRVHVDDEADRINRALAAKASTYGRDIFFRKGAYRPHTTQGQSLLAHELTHVGQQTGQTGAPQGGAAIQRVLHWDPDNLTTGDAKEPDPPARVPFGAALERDYYRTIVELTGYYNRLSPTEKESEVGLSWLDAIKRAILGWQMNYEAFLGDSIVTYNPNVEDHAQMLSVFGELIDREFQQGATKRDSGLKGGTKLGAGAISEVLKVKSKWLGKAKVWKEESWAGNAGSNKGGAARAPAAMGVNFFGSNLSGRSVAASDLDKALLGKSGVLGRSKFGVRGGKFGQIQDFVKGKTLKSQTKDERDDLYKNWKIVRDLQHLQLMDFITGQVDRHHENILITKSGIKGIDSDFGFGSKKLTDIPPMLKGAYGIHNKGLPQFITKKFAKSIKDMSEHKLRSILINKLRDEEVETAVDHLELVQNAIDDNTITLLDNSAKAWKAVLGTIDQKKSYMYKA